MMPMRRKVMRIFFTVFTPENARTAISLTVCLLYRPYPKNKKNPNTSAINMEISYPIQIIRATANRESTLISIIFHSLQRVWVPLYAIVSQVANKKYLFRKKVMSWKRHKKKIGNDVTEGSVFRCPAHPDFRHQSTV